MAPIALRTFVRAFADIFFPRFCIVCQRPVAEDNAVDLCPSCESSIALPEGRYCPKCAAPMAEYAHACPNCHNMRLAMNGSAAFGLYDGELRERIIEYKFSKRRYLARTFGRLVAGAVMRQWPDASFDAVVAAPLHPRRARERGFDQAREIARYAAAALAVPARPRLLKRVRATQSQVGLTKTARTRNVKGAFEAAAVSGMKSVLVVDDIMTTGATLSEAARALKRAGASEVYAAVVARTGLAAADPQDEPMAMEGLTQ